MLQLRLATGHRFLVDKRPSMIRQKTLRGSGKETLQGSHVVLCWVENSTEEEHHLKLHALWRGPQADSTTTDSGTELEALDGQTE